ncbi:MAG: hypothetical protein ACXWKO_06090 [Phenylobacterium sp.]
MAYGQIDPARLDGDALTRWCLRSPADIEQERQAAAAQSYNDFFGNPYALRLKIPWGPNEPSNNKAAPVAEAALEPLVRRRQIGTEPHVEVPIPGLDLDEDAPIDKS